MNQIQNHINTIQSNLELYDAIISPNNKKVISEYIQRLHRINELLDVDKYKLVFIGAPGVGKTTLICNYLDLISDNFINKQADEVPLLNTASGKTTAAEIHILTGKRSLIHIEACSQKEQINYIKSYCRSLWDKVFDKEIEIDEVDNSKKEKKPDEIYRMIKNMAGFTKEAGYSHEEDIKNEIIQKYKATEYNNFYNYMIAKTGITKRNTLSVSYGSKTDFKVWLKKTFSDINLGKMPGVPIPKRIFIQISQKDLELPIPEWADEVIDTRGFDGEGRVDVKSLIHQDNTINIVLDKITTPIDEKLHPIFNSWIVKENVDIIPRLSLVVACRTNELNSVCEAENEENGEEIKRSEIDTCIKANKLNYNNENTLFYNAQGAYETKNVPRKNGAKINNISVITNINKENANIYRSFFTEHISEIKDRFRNNLLADAEDILQRTSNIFNSLKKQPTLLDIERNRIASKLEELKEQALSTFVNNKSVITSFDSLFDMIKNRIHWASIRKTTETYGEWEKCHIYALMEEYLWKIVYQEISSYKIQIDKLFASVDSGLSDYTKSYLIAEREAYLKFKIQVENLGYTKMFDAFNISECEPRKEFWSTAQSISGKGYLNNVIECYKNWINNNGCDKGLCEAVRQLVLQYIDTIIDVVS